MIFECERNLELGIFWLFDSERSLPGEFPDFDPYQHLTWHEADVLGVVARTETLGPVRIKIVVDEPADLLAAPNQLGSGEIAVHSGRLTVRFTDAVFPDDEAPSVNLLLTPGDYQYAAHGNDDGDSSSVVVLSLSRVR